MPARELDDLDSFLGDNKRGGGTLSGWKEDGEIIIWLARLPVGKPVSLWRHPFPVVQLKDAADEDSKPERRVFMFPTAVCHEDERILKEQYFREKDGTRQNPPKRCPICRYIEWVRGQVDSGVIEDTKLAMRVDATDASKSVIIHAGGLYNYGGKKQLDDRANAERLKKAGVSIHEAFKENMQAKHEYLLRVVDDGDPAAGIQKIFVSGDLGDKIKDVIGKARLDLGKDEGNPYLNPYAFKLIYREKEKNIGKKYDVQKLGKQVFTPEIEEAIAGQGPDVAQLMEPFNRASVRANLERWNLLRGVPWDEIFAPYEDVEDHADKEPPRRREAAPAAEEETPRRRKKKADKPEPPPPPKQEETIPCDECKAPMPASATKCAKCGTEYEVTDDEPKPGKQPKPDKAEQSPADDIPF